MISISMPSLISQLKEASGSVTSSASRGRQMDLYRSAAYLGMHPSSTSTTPFSVKDILKLEYHHDFENEFPVSNPVFPTQYQHVHSASRSRTHIHEYQPEPCASGMQGKLEAPNSEEEINEQGETCILDNHPVILR